MSGEGVEESREERNARLDAEERFQEEYLAAHGFDKTVVRLGGDGVLSLLAGGVQEAGVCLGCYCLVPIVDLTGGTTAVEAHEKKCREKTT